MPISYSCIDVSSTCRQALSSLVPDDSVEPSKHSQPSSVSQISSGRNRTETLRMIENAKSDTLFNAFPVELRTEIFLQVCGSYCPIGKINEGPILLLRICRAWRTLTLQTPQLWSSFALDLRPTPGPEKSAFLISVMKEWIARSRNLPLSFKIHYNYPTDDSCTDPIQALLPTATRWRDVTLYAPSVSLLPLWEAKPDSFPALKSLTVETFGSSPFLLGGLRINWAQITQLDLFLITIPTLDECLSILKEAINLRCCSMNAVCVFSGDPPEHVCLPSLRHLQLKLYGGNSTGSLLDQRQTKFLAFMGALSLPGLESLSIAWHVVQIPYHTDVWTDCDRFVGILENLRHLKELSLAYLPFSTRQILQCLGAVPSLHTLSILLSQADGEPDLVNDEFFSALTLQPDRSGMLPYLENIRLQSHGESFSNPVFLRFVASRWRYQVPCSHTRCLESIGLISPKRHAEYRPRRFQDVKEGQLEVLVELKSEFSMLEVLGAFMNKDSYGEQICFMNDDFPSDIRPLLLFN